VVAVEVYIQVLLVLAAVVVLVGLGQELLYRLLLVLSTPLL
jgi:hypothetical protein